MLQVVFVNDLNTCSVTAAEKILWNAAAQQSKKLRGELCSQLKWNSNHVLQRFQDGVFFQDCSAHRHWPHLCTRVRGCVVQHLYTVLTETTTFLVVLICFC